MAPSGPTFSTPHVRNANPADAESIFKLIESMVDDGTLLRRPLDEIQQHIDTFVVAESAEGTFLGCAALYRYGKHLAEIRSIAILPEGRGIGAGGLLLKRLLQDIQETGATCACLFTRLPAFFAHYGFHEVSLDSVPEKVAKDCVRCPRREHCDETAMTYGERSYESLAALKSDLQLVQL